MRESISYSFLLNIVILFIFTCFAIVMGILSYYKAFRANTIISETIEKYEGYNCLSKEEITRKLNGIGYNTPFKVSCKKADGRCDDSGNGYKVISYNLDFEGNLVYDGEQMNSTYICDSNGCATNKHYQYGIYTYMYVELPVVANLIRIPFFSKTSIMYDYRNYYIDGQSITDVEDTFDTLYTRNTIDGKLYVNDAKKFAENEGVSAETNYNISSIIMKIYVKRSTVEDVENYTYLFSNISGKTNFDYRNRAMIQKMIADRRVDSQLSSNIWADGLNGRRTRRACGYQFNYDTINKDKTL